MENENIYFTSDLVLAATLATLDYPLKTIQPYQDNRFNFVFGKDSNIEQIVSQFKDDKIAVEPKKFTYHYKTIKQKLFDRVREGRLT